MDVGEEEREQFKNESGKRGGREVKKEWGK